jgi:hypothetical protein
MEKCKDDLIENLVNYPRQLKTFLAGNLNFYSRQEYFEKVKDD